MGQDACFWRFFSLFWIFVAETPLIRYIARNRKAFHNYFILQRFEAGIVLLGTEVKSARSGAITLRESYALLDKGELWLHNLNIHLYDHRGYEEHEPRRRRKLLLQKRELRRIEQRIIEKGLAVIPLSLYFKGPYLKVELALVRGKRQYDKRAQKEKAQMQRELDREMKGRYRIKS
jgi:SsrA-binding protein